MVCAPRCPLCREQLQGPFRVNHVLEDMIALLQIQSPQRPSPGFGKSSKGFGKPWQELSGGLARSQLPQLPSLALPRQPLQQLASQPQARQAEPQPRQPLSIVELRPPSPRLALPSLVPPSPPQALVPIQYTRRVPTEVPTLEQAVREALPGTIVLLARGTHTLSSPLVVAKQIRIKGEGSPSECQLVCSGTS